MAIGYAAFSTVLTINSTSEITSSRDVEITSVRAVNDSSLTYNDAYDKVAPAISNDKQSVTIQTGLLSPGDIRIYELEVTNKGNLDSEVTTVFNNIINDSTLFSYDGVSPIGSDGTDILSVGGSYDTSTLVTEEPFDLPAFINNNRYLYLMIKFKDSVTSQPKDLNPSVTLSISAVQKSDNTPTVPIGTETVLVGGVEVPVVTSGDGLYSDSTEKGRYVYRGANPDNYIKFNNEVWRIISFENDGTIKIIRNESIGQFPFDEAGNRSSEMSTYCIDAAVHGCNAWATTSNLIGNPIEFVMYYPNGNSSIDTIIYPGTVTEDSRLNFFLNGEYYDNSDSNIEYLGTDKVYVTKHNFYVGTPGTTDYDMEYVALDSEQEKEYIWRGKVGLIQATDYIKASIDSTCTSLNSNRYGKNCGTTNWLKPAESYYWTISPYPGDGEYINNIGYRVGSSGRLTGNFVSREHDIRPTIYLKTNITLTGNGGSSSEDIFKIVSQN